MLDGIFEAGSGPSELVGGISLTAGDAGAGVGWPVSCDIPADGPILVADPGRWMADAAL